MARNQPSMVRRQRERARQQKRREKQEKRRERRELKKLETPEEIGDNPREDPTIDWDSAVRQTPLEEIEDPLAHLDELPES